MNRRQFIALSGSASLAAMTSTPALAQAAEEPSGREFYELRQVSVENEAQKKQVDNFLQPSCNLQRMS